MANRGDVVRLHRRTGFLASDRDERFVVMQSDRLNTHLPTTYLLPLEAYRTAHAGNPLTVRVPGSEAGLADDQIAHATSMLVVSWKDVRPGVCGHASLATLARIDAVLRLVLDLP